MCIVSQDHMDVENRVSKELEEPGAEPVQDSPVSNLAYAINTECAADSTALQVCLFVCMSITLVVLQNLSTAYLYSIFEHSFTLELDVILVQCLLVFINCCLQMRQNSIKYLVMIKLSK